MLFSLLQCSYSQVFEEYNFVLNGDKSPFEVQVENKTPFFVFKKTDIVTITINEFNSENTNKDFKIISMDNQTELLISTIHASDINAEEAFKIDIAFNLPDAKQKSLDLNKLHHLVVYENGTHQKLLAFKLKEE